MNHRIIVTAAALLTLAPLAASAQGDLPAARRQMPMNAAGLASTTAPIRARIASTTQALADKKLEQARERAGKEIDRRIEALEKFANRIGDAKRVSEEGKTALGQTMQQEITNMNALRARIESETSTSSLKEAVQSITESYRIFALVIPQSAIYAAADRVNMVAAQLKELSTKLAARVAEAQTAGKDVAALTAALTSMDGRIADAIAQAQAAVAEVTALKPDNGDKAILDANKKALENAHKKIQAAHQDLQDARHDAQTIVQGLRGLGKQNRPTTTTPATGSAQ